MVAALSPQHVARLLAEPFPDLRGEIAGKVAANLTGPGRAPREIAMAQDIVRVLAQDVAAGVRASIARGPRQSRNLPHDVALPPLADRICLADDDMIEVVRRGSALKQEAVTGRLNLTAPVADALITHAVEPAVIAQVLIHDPSRRGLAAVYWKAMPPRALFEAVRAAVGVVDETGFDGNARDLKRFQARGISRVLALVEMVDASDADALIQKLGDVLVDAPDSAERDTSGSHGGSAP
jgi:uncharacterized protein (DUF2336 family)